MMKSCVKLFTLLLLITVAIKAGYPSTASVMNTANAAAVKAYNQIVPANMQLQSDSSAWLQNPSSNASTYNQMAMQRGKAAALKAYQESYNEGLASGSTITSDQVGAMVNWQTNKSGLAGNDLLSSVLSALEGSVAEGTDLVEFAYSNQLFLRSGIISSAKDGKPFKITDVNGDEWMIGLGGQQPYASSSSGAQNPSTTEQKLAQQMSKDPNFKAILEDKSTAMGDEIAVIQQQVSALQAGGELTGDQEQALSDLQSLQEQLAGGKKVFDDAIELFNSWQPSGPPAKNPGDDPSEDPSNDPNSGTQKGTGGDDSAFSDLVSKYQSAYENMTSTESGTDLFQSLRATLAKKLSAAEAAYKQAAEDGSEDLDQLKEVYDNAKAAAEAWNNVDDGDGPDIPVS